jgi:hypothetical protein
LALSLSSSSRFEACPRSACSTAGSPFFRSFTQKPPDVTLGLPDLLGGFTLCDQLPLGFLQCDQPVAVPLRHDKADTPVKPLTPEWPESKLLPSTE